MNIEERVKQLISEHLGVPLEEVLEKADFIQDLNAQTIEITDIILAIEQAYKIKIPEEEQKNIQTVGDLINAVTDQLT